jgi:hypothetical protein
MFAPPLLATTGNTVCYQHESLPAHTDVLSAHQLLTMPVVIVAACSDNAARADQCFESCKSTVMQQGFVI